MFAFSSSGGFLFIVISQLCFYRHGNKWRLNVCVVPARRAKNRMSKKGHLTLESAKRHRETNLNDKSLAVVYE